MKLLIDTNILILLEDNRIINENFSKFYRIAINNECKIVYHPNAIPIDIEKDKDVSRKKVIKSKLLKYERLNDFSEPSSNFLKLIKNNNENDKVDNIQLFQVYRGYVDFFITQDIGIHKNAKKLGLKDKVLKINEILNVLEDLYTVKIPFHPILRQHSIREIENKFNSPFFDSLRNDYNSEAFNQWLKKCVIKNRQCYTLLVEDELHAILIYNIEKVEEHQLPNIYENVLKICTLKVADTVFGIKLGELFLNKMFELCINQKTKYLYLTVYDKQTHLITLLITFGFRRETFINNQGFEEVRMIKCLNKYLLTNTQENSIRTHPFYADNSNISKYVIPIQPQYYETLFKDAKLRPPTLFDSFPDSINEIQGNTIIKAYISNSKIKRLKQGDILFFYSSKSNKAIEPVGILETIQIVNGIDELLRIVSKKSVFSQENLETWLEEKGSVHVITFRIITYLNKKINLKRISSLKSLQNKIQTITRLSEEDYLDLKNEGYFDKRYIID